MWLSPLVAANLLLLEKVRGPKEMQDALLRASKSQVIYVATT